MKRKDFSQLALAGLASGILITSPLAAEDSKSSSNDDNKSGTSKAYDPNDGNMNYHVMSEDELLMQLNPEGIAMYKSLDSKGKALALLVASSMCDHTNECKGLNACQTDDHACAGKGQCKGQGKCSFSDKNLAVKLVRDKMAGKRANANSPAQNKPAPRRGY